MLSPQGLSPSPWAAAKLGTAGASSPPAQPLLAARTVPPARAGAKANASARAAACLLSLLQLRCLKNIPGFVHWSVDNKTVTPGEHRRGNNDRLAVIFITDALEPLEEAVTAQKGFSNLSQFFIAGDINSKPTLLSFQNLTHIFRSPSLLAWFR